MEVKVTATLGNTLYQTEVKAGKNSIISDEPTDLGGGDTGLNPFELLASALATCTAATLRMYLNMKKWEVDEIVVQVEMEDDKPNQVANFKREVQFVGGTLDEAQKKRLLTIAEKCPVHRIITGNVNIETTIQN
ncbi:OsmC family protein [Myroides sp. 1354]|uniref:OsmC family protein n=1 Tax=unclassified Myroides TaxID=2642485 RepID=UPI002576AEBA|nr:MULTISPECIES: OsmC family protein [unclassified Myroides]MDM1044804.1 OsmC family protein [Myroides sp. R163-1]MDM1055517.1 OsmC family protein [Myroides sp. 1354]MDM1068814.1 OsmC family protein [Myroides sp. 1372]